MIQSFNESVSAWEPVAVFQDNLYLSVRLAKRDKTLPGLAIRRPLCRMPWRYQHRNGGSSSPPISGPAVRKRWPHTRAWRGNSPRPLSLPPWGPLGKRSAVKDPHDRYANVETAYLLQKMEEYEGIAIPTTNFRKNMDDAFARRMHHVVEFSFPDAAQRLRIWKGLIPRGAELAEAVDFGFLARQFELAGGNIRNIGSGRDLPGC